MNDEFLVKEWLEYAKMDFDTAVHLHQTMVPEPLEIVCYHCQQFVEKTLKAMLIAKGFPVAKTHDLGILAAQLAETIDVPEEVLDACDNLSPYGVKVRYPRELFVEKHHAQEAVREAKVVQNWAAVVIHKK